MASAATTSLPADLSGLLAFIRAMSHGRQSSLLVGWRVNAARQHPPVAKAVVKKSTIAYCAFFLLEVSFLNRPSPYGDRLSAQQKPICTVWVCLCFLAASLKLLGYRCRPRVWTWLPCKAELVSVARSSHVYLTSVRIDQDTAAVAVRSRIQPSDPSSTSAGSVHANHASY